MFYKLNEFRAYIQRLPHELEHVDSRAQLLLGYHYHHVHALLGIRDDYYVLEFGRMREGQRVLLDPQVVVPAVDR